MEKGSLSLKKILILGIGNILFGDEGFGPHMISYLKDKYTLNSNDYIIDLIDGGTLAHQLIPIITDYENVLILDCISVDGGEVGDVYYFNFEEAIQTATWQGSAHEAEMLQTLMMIKMFGDLPDVKILGVVPFIIGEDSTFTLSNELLAASITVEEKILEYIKNFHIDINIKNSVNLQDIAKTTFIRDVR